MCPFGAQIFRTHDHMKINFALDKKNIFGVSGCNIPHYEYPRLWGKMIVQYHKGKIKVDDLEKGNVRNLMKIYWKSIRSFKSAFKS